jgi:hypothetical protein
MLGDRNGGRPPLDEVLDALRDALRKLLRMTLSTRDCSGTGKTRCSRLLRPQCRPRISSLGGTEAALRC